VRGAAAADADRPEPGEDVPQRGIFHCENAAELLPCFQGLTSEQHTPVRHAGLADRDTFPACHELWRFYALGIGLGLATITMQVAVSSRRRFYALGIGLGLATKRVLNVSWTLGSFYALGIGLGLATEGDPQRALVGPLRRVSMPSVSGWA
jgi:hypothetical protein